MGFREQLNEFVEEHPTASFFIMLGVFLFVILVTIVIVVGSQSIIDFFMNKLMG